MVSYMDKIPKEKKKINVILSSSLCEVMLKTCSSFSYRSRKQVEFLASSPSTNGDLFLE